MNDRGTGGFAATVEATFGFLNEHGFIVEVLSTDTVIYGSPLSCARSAASRQGRKAAP